MSAMVALPLLAVSMAVGAPPAIELVRRELTVPGPILAVTSGDLDGDGRFDLVVSFRKGAGPNAVKRLGLFFRRSEGLPPRPDLVVPAPSNAALFDVGDVDGDGAADLVYLTASGVFFQRVALRPTPKVGPVARVVASPTLVVTPEEEDLVGWDFLRTIGSDAQPTLIVPGRRRIRLYGPDKGRWKERCAIRVPQLSYYDAEKGHYRPTGRGGASGRPYAFRVTTIVPNLDFAEQTGDGRLDLITHFEDRITVHPGDERGCFAEAPRSQQWFRVRTRTELESRDQRVSAQIADFDGDGVADLALTKIGGGIRTLRTEVRLYAAKTGGGFEGRPRQVFKDDGFGTLVDFVDVDGDGTLEMVHPYAAVSIMSMTRAMLSSSIGVEVRIRAADRAAGFFAPRPRQTLDVSIGLDLSSGAALRGSAPLLGYDFDGDGRRDAVVSSGATAMVLHPGRAPNRRGWFDEDRKISIQAPGTNATQVLLAGKGAPPEVLMFYPRRPKLSGTMYVFARVLIPTD